MKQHDRKHLGGRCQYHLLSGEVGTVHVTWQNPRYFMFVPEHDWSIPALWLYFWTCEKMRPQRAWSLQQCLARPCLVCAVLVNSDIWPLITVSNKASLQNQLQNPALVTLKNIMRPLTAWLENSYYSIIVANHQLITVIRFVVKNYTHPWKDFANRLHLVHHACEILL